MPFQTELIFQNIPGQLGRFRLVRPLVYVYSRTEEVFTVPAGFPTDLASIPQVFQNIASKLGKNIEAAVLHDYLYAKGFTSKKLADKIFLIALKECGVSFWKRRLMYVIVKYFGGAVWRKHRKNDKIKEEVN